MRDAGGRVRKRVPASRVPRRDTKLKLWERLTEYNFENLVQMHLLDHVLAMFGSTNPSIKAFANKVSGKHGWTIEFTLRAIEEYKKFVYLGMVSDSEVTPSRVIDQVWHEHMLFTKGYREFCETVLGRNFDHSPELIPLEDQTGVFNAQYNYVISLYWSEFNREPPVDIWGKPKFDQKKVSLDDYEPKRKRNEGDSGPDPLSSFVYVEQDPLHTVSSDFDGFGGGKSGGAGAGATWSEAISSHSHDSHSGHSDGGHGGDSGSSGDNGGSSGCSSGGSSGCSSGGSSCGGGGCGGGGGD